MSTPALRSDVSAQSQGKALYPCADCGALRTKAEGGTTFTVCDECWEKQAGTSPEKRRADYSPFN